MRLHVLGIEGYDAVAFYDQDIEFQGDVSDMFLCASTGMFLSASGGVGEPLNVGFFALRPDPKLLAAAEEFADGLKFSWTKGWDNAGFEPAGTSKFIGAECGQGYFHTLLYDRKSKKAQAAMVAAGFSGVEAANAVQIDRCVWNYQTGSNCPRKFDCGLVRAHHKPNGKHPGRDCTKLAARTELHYPTPGPLPPPSAASTLPCEIQNVQVGANCNCKPPGPNDVKTISFPGYPVACQPEAFDPSGDSFAISVAPTAGANAFRLTATRTDADSCWCDQLAVKCCVVRPEVVAAAGMAS